MTSCVVAGAVLRGAFRALCLLVGARVAPTPTPTSPPQGVRNVASVCLQIGYPTIASVPHSIVNGYKRVLAVAVETDYTFPLAEKVKAFLADPSAFVAAAPVVVETAAPAAAAAPAKEAPKEESEESDEDMGFGLFD